MSEAMQYHLGRKRGPENARQWKYRLVPQAAVDRSKVRSLAKYFLQPPFDQGAEGSCTANSGALIQMACAAISGVASPPVLSRMDLYWDERVDEGDPGQDNGAQVSDSFDSAIKRGGIVLDSVWPYDAKPAEQPPAAVAKAKRYLFTSGHQPIDAADFIDGILTALDNTQPLALAFNFYNGFFHDYQQTGILAMHPGDTVAGGHQITVKGWLPNNGGLVWCQNSWGATSPARTDLHPDAKAGDVFLPLVMLTNGVVDEVRAAVPVAAPAPQPTPTPTPKPQGCKALADAGFAQCIAQAKAGAIADPANAAWYAYLGGTLVPWVQATVDAEFTATTAAVAMPKRPD